MLELLVASLVSMAVIGMSVGLTLSTRELYFYDQARIELNQNLRGALEVIGIDTREGGERINSTFPAVQVTNGAGSDELYLRRNLLDQVLIVCQDVSAGSGVTKLFLSGGTSAVAPCTYGAQSANITAWESYRTEHDNTVKVYVFNQTSRVGEFVDYNGITDSSGQVNLEITSHSFANPFAEGLTSVYILEEQRYRLDNGMLQVLQDGDLSNPKNVTYGMTDFQVVGHMQDGTTKTSLDVTDDWTTLESIEPVLTGESRVTGRSGILGNKRIIRTLSARFFPRNILSN